MRKWVSVPWATPQHGTAGRHKGPMGSYWWEQGAGEAPSAMLVLSGCRKRSPSWVRRPPPPSCRQHVHPGGDASAGVCGLNSIRSSPMPMPCQVSKLCVWKEGERG